MKLSQYKLFIILISLGFPAESYVNGGGPLLLVISGSAFLFGQVCILASETYLYTRLVRLDVRTAFGPFGD